MTKGSIKPCTSNKTIGFTLTFLLTMTMTSSSYPWERNFTARKLLVIWTNPTGHIFSWFAGLPEAGRAQLRPLRVWVPVICSLLGSSPRDYTCLANLRQPRSFIWLGLLSTHVCVSQLLTLAPNIKCIYL